MRGGEEGIQGGQKFLLAVQALFVHATVVTSHFDQLQCDVPGGTGVEVLAGRRRWRTGFRSKIILWLALQHQERVGTLLQDQVEMEASEVGMEAGLREAGNF